MVGRVLIVDSVSVNRIILRVKLSSAYFDVLQCASCTAAIDLAQLTEPDLILASDEIADMDVAGFCARLKAVLGELAPPVLLLSNTADRSARLNGLGAGASDVLQRPISDRLLLARMHNLIRRRSVERDLHTRLQEGGDVFASFLQGSNAPRAEVALVMPPGPRARTCLRALRSQTPHRIALVPPDGAVRRAVTAREIDLFVLVKDQEGPAPALDLLTELRSGPATRNSGVVVVLGPHQIDTAHRALDLGAEDVMFQGVDNDELAIRVNRQTQAKWRADCLRNHVRDSLKAAVTDSLTGLHNRRYALRKLVEISSRAAETSTPFAVMIADLDHFKRINDTHGHLAGDDVLKDVARRLASAVGPNALLARIGGEEFLIALPDTTAEQAEAAAKRLCTAVSAKPFRLRGVDRFLRSTVSIGLAMGQGPSQTAPLDLIAQADRALYAAKAEGRNQVTVSRSAA